ncbi:MAG: DUF4384 domain-containing protein [Meiothermus sp.]|nr:DUF4384 domain-containing protein [Meiothermus sp.]
MKRIIASTLIAAGLAAQAAPQLTPQGIIVNPILTDLEVQTWVNKDPSGYGNSTYFFGEKIQISARVNQDAYVYIFNINADGQIDLILPNQLNQDNFMRSGETRQFPQPGARYEFTISGPAGVDQVLAVASRQPLSLAQIADVRSGQTRVQGASNLARALSIVVTPLPQDDWVSDVVRYSVQQSGAVVPNPRPPVVVNPQPRPAPQPWFAVRAPNVRWGVVWEQKGGSGYSVVYRYGDIEQVFRYYHDDLLAKGWVKVRFEGRGPAYHAYYQRGGQYAEVDISPRQGQLVVSLDWR